LLVKESGEGAAEPARHGAAPLLAETGGDKMHMARRIVNALKGAGSAERPRPGRLLHSRPEDLWRDYPADGLTPSRLSAILKLADTGALDEPMQLFEQMEEKDAHLFSVASTRRLALTGLDWEIVSWAELRPTKDRAAADAAARYCREVLGDMETFDSALVHLSQAVGRNLAVAELVWEEVNGELVLSSIVPVDFTRLVFNDEGELRILTESEPADGIPLVPNKFVVHTPHNVSGHPSRGGLLRATALAFLGKQYAVKDWMIYAEVFGMPVRVGKYDPKATEAEKRELLEMLRNMGAEAAGVFSKSVSLEFLDANRGTPPPPYESMVNFFNREMSKAWLGQTLTTDATGSPGSFAVAKIHEQVRQDLREDDIRKEGEMVRREILKPLVRLKFGEAAPVPFFRRRLRGPGNTEGLAKMLAVAVNDLGMSVDRQWAHDALGIPAGGTAKGVLTRRAAESAAEGGGSPGS
jgi:phage gp29-like protein